MSVELKHLLSLCWGHREEARMGFQKGERGLPASGSILLPMLCKADPGRGLLSTMALSWLLSLRPILRLPLSSLPSSGGFSGRLPRPPSNPGRSTSVLLPHHSFSLLSVCPRLIPTHLEHEPHHGRPCLPHISTPGA